MGYTAQKLFCRHISDDQRVFSTDSDVGLIKLDFPLQLGDASVYNIQKTDSYNDDLKSDQSYAITVAGWGQVNLKSQRLSSRLRKAEVHSFDARQRISAYPFYRPDQQISIWKKGQSPCKADSGGPEVIRNHLTGKEFLVGVISYAAFPLCE